MKAKIMVCDEMKNLDAFAQRFEQMDIEVYHVKVDIHIYKMLHLDFGITHIVMKQENYRMYHPVIQRQIGKKGLIIIGEGGAEPYYDGTECRIIESMSDAEIAEVLLKAYEQGSKRIAVVNDARVIRGPKGIDIEKGVSLCGGKKELYLQVLRTCLFEGEKKLPLLREYQKNQSEQSYMIEAHAIKSMAASVGAEELSKLAKRHEFAIKGNETGFIQEHSEELICAYEEFLGQLALYIERESDAQESDGIRIEKVIGDLEEEPLDPKLVKQLLEFIEDFDDEGAGVLAEQLLYEASEEDREILQKVIANLSIFDYDSALENCKRLQNDSKTEEA